MLLIPYYTFDLVTDKDKIGVLNILEYETRKRGVFFNPFDPERFKKSFIGEITNNCFSFRRISLYNNSISPDIKGNVTSIEPGATKLSVKIRYNIFTNIFFIFYLGFALFGSIVGLASDLIKGPLTSKNIVFLLLFIYGYCFYMGIFNYEVKKTVDLFNNLLKKQGGV